MWLQKDYLGTFLQKNETVSLLKNLTLFFQLLLCVLSLNVCPESHLESNGWGTALTLDLITLTNN